MEVDIEKEALTIAANTMKRIADEARAEVARLSNDLAVATAQRDALAQKAASSPDAALWARLKDAEERAEEYLDFLRSTKQLVAFGYWQQRRRELRAEEAKRMTA